MENREFSETIPDTEAPASAEEGKSVSEETESNKDLLQVKFNHKTHNLTLDKAKTLAQKGMLYEKRSLDDIYTKLDYLAAQSEISVEQLVNGLLEKDEADYRASIAEKCGDDKEMLENLTALYKDRQKEKYGKITKARDEAEIARQSSAQDRVENEFNDLKRDFNELSTIEDLPASVMENALNGQDLLSAYLVFLHNENKKIIAAKQQEAKANTAAMEPIKATNNEPPVNSAFVAGLWRGI